MISWSTSDIAGIHLGDSHITAARVERKGDVIPVITHVGCVSYDASASEKDIAGVLKSLWRSARMPTKMVCASLRSPSLVMRYFRMPTMSETEMRSALTLQAEEALQLTRDKLSVDWSLQERPKGNAEAVNPMIEGILAASPSKDVERQLEILTLAGLDPVIVDVRAMAVANLFLLLDEQIGESSVCLVNMSPHSADVIVIRRLGGIYPYTVFCRASTWGDAPGFLAENIRDVLKYSEFKLDWDSVKRVLLTGEVPESKAFIEQLKTDLNLAVTVWNPLEVMTLKDQRVKEKVLELASTASLLVPSLGLALRRA